jgi:signal peptidase I
MSLGAKSPPKTRFWLVSLGSLFALVLLWQGWFAFSLVSGDSMAPTYATGDLLLIHKRAYAEREPRRGDIVVARVMNGLMVKRLVGLPGEKVEVRAGRVLVDQQALVEKHSVKPGVLDIGPGRLAPGKYALLGDNRALGPGATVHAVVPKDRILGRVIFSWHW